MSVNPPLAIGATPFPGSPEAAQLQQQAQMAAATQLNHQLHQAYTLPNGTQPTSPPPTIDPQIQQQIQNSINGLQNHPAYTQGVDLRSVALNVEADGKPKQVLENYAGGDLGTIFGNAGKQFFEQTIGQVIKTFQDNPTKGLEELGVTGAILGGVAVAQFIPGLDILVDGGLLAWGATQALPPLFNSILDEVHHPSDANLTHLLVNGGMAYITMGSPIKAFRGMKAKALIHRDQILSVAQRRGDLALVDKIVKGTATETDLEPYLISGNTLLQRSINPNIPEVRQKVPAPQGNALIEFGKAKGLPMQGQKAANGSLGPEITPEDIKAWEQYRDVDKIKMLHIAQKVKMEKILQEGAAQDERLQQLQGELERAATPEETQRLQGEVDRVQQEQQSVASERKVAQDLVEQKRVALDDLIKDGGDWQTKMQRFAYHWQYLASPHANAFATKMTRGQEALFSRSVDRLQKKVAGQVSAVANSLHEVAQVPVETQLEMISRVSATAGPVASEIQSDILDLMKELNLKESDLTVIENALHDPYGVVDEAKHGQLSQELARADLTQIDRDIAKLRADSKWVGTTGSAPATNKRIQEELDRKLAERDTLVETQQRVQGELDRGTWVGSLTDNQNVGARILEPLFGMMTGARMERGTVPLSDPNYYGFHLVYDNIADIGSENPAAGHVHRMLRDNYVDHANWDVNIDHDTGYIEMKRHWTPAKYDAAQKAETDKFQSSADYRAIQATRSADTVQNGEVVAKGITSLRHDKGVLKRNVSRYSNQLDATNKKLAETQKTIQDAEYTNRLGEMALAPMKNMRRDSPEKKRLLDKQAELQKIIKEQRKLERQYTTDLQGTKDHPERGIIGKGVTAAQEEQKFYDELDPEIKRHVMADDVEKPGRPGAQHVLRGADWLKYSIRQYVLDMVKTGHYDALLARSTTEADKFNEMGIRSRDVGTMVGKGLTATARIKTKAGQTLTDKEAAAEWAKRPDVLPETAFRNEHQATQIGYRQIVGQMGTADELNYRPALWAKPSVADDYLKNLRAVTDYKELDGLLGTVSKVQNVTRAAVFLSPMVHFFNVAGRNLAMMLNDPSGYGAAMQSLFGKYFTDPAAYAYLRTRFHMAGGVPAYRFQVTHHLNTLAADETGQVTWPGAIRTGVNIVRNPYNDIVEKGFWKMVDDVGLIGFMAEEARLVSRGVHEDIASMAAAEYGNQIAGMVNPLYTSQTWRHMRGFFSFAPSYWSTFMRSAESAIMAPGGLPIFTRLGYHIGKHVTGISPARIKNLDYKVWREIVRAQSSWFSTYMSSMMVFADAMNVIGSGHHIWDNQSGRTFDIDLSNIVEPGIAPNGEEKRAYMSSVPFFRQAVDVGNALGLGHDWGLGHALNDQNFQKADATKKTLDGVAALWDGFRRVGSGKMSQVAAASFIATMGLDPQQFLGQSRKVETPNWEAATALLPTGFTARRVLNDWQKSQIAPPGEQPLQQFTLADEIKAELSSAQNQLTGLPSLFWMGTERPHGVDDAQLQKYASDMSALHTQALWNSDMAENGVQGYTLYKWLQDRQQIMSKSIALSAATFKDSPAGALSKARLDLLNAYGLDKQTGITPDQFYEKLDMYENDWEKILNSASPEAKAVWWDHERKQWTNMDYLYWYTRQLKQEFMGMVDGQNGALIRQQQHDLYARFGTIMDVTDPTTRSQIEQQFPAYYAYRQLLKGIGKTSPLGAMISGFTSPYATMKILPKGITPTDLENLMQYASSSTALVQPESMQQIIGDVQSQAGSYAAKRAGGQVKQTQAFQQEATQEAQAGEAALQTQ